MPKSLLNSVVNDLTNQDIKTEFIARIHTETGISKDELNEVYDLGIKTASETKASVNPVPWGKSRVYRFVSTLKT